jgi:hypothetical protein
VKERNKYTSGTTVIDREIGPVSSVEKTGKKVNSLLFSFVVFSRSQIQNFTGLLDLWVCLSFEQLFIL